MSADRTGCCATWPKPCPYHEGWADAEDAACSHAAWELRPGDGAPSRMERLHAVLSPASVCRADVPPELHADLWWLWRLASRALEVCEWAEGREGADGSVAPVDDVWLVYSEGDG